MGLFSNRTSTAELRAEAETVKKSIAAEEKFDAVRPPSSHMYADTNMASYQHRLKEINDELKRRS
ncbi:hypothetical protein [Streptomyces echinatus]|uniref:Uncharacterized protein n=1 Tax=Streptomyces echinatus TaxID=67293 RepID=A0A7W9Q2B3_9ACTN|nr:hypothetical protein [Streptomyces echinatus]MBB5932333.1 hypothetical protein [Streptomyces echinatus]